ncbi:MAG TPA: S-methyl-5-thioribose-1-phosphate isomerase [Spongiibacteraceae bacterium]|nr:S-methyl-5-thioribose-1-phosphate isomerase [Spongiibacteraceae bacterium]
MPASTIEPLRWLGDTLELLDQRRLPAEEIYLAYRDAEDVAQAIRTMVVRGAPAIGIAAAYGMALAAQRIDDARSAAIDWEHELTPALQTLAAARPTAVNLFWALAQARAIIRSGGAVASHLAAWAVRIHREDIANNRRIGAFGATLIAPSSNVYTHCNAGALATGGYGTALGVIRSAFAAGNIEQVYAGETRPWWQGARLTSWELLREQIPVTLCTEGAAGWVLQQKNIRWIIVGADRIAANGDVANKIGTYNLAILARHHGVKMMVAAPTSTFDLSIADGTGIPIEQRAAEEITQLHGADLAPPDCGAINPAFDITPAALIDAIVTEFGIIERPDSAAIARHFADRGARQID